MQLSRVSCGQVQPDVWSEGKIKQTTLCKLVVKAWESDMRTSVGNLMDRWRLVSLTADDMYSTRFAFHLSIPVILAMLRLLPADATRRQASASLVQ
jgi:hypothetical protein